MKKAVYFVVNSHQSHELEIAIRKAVEKREEFLLKNEKLIGEIVNEDIKITYFNANMSQVSVVIVLTYYPSK